MPPWSTPLWRPCCVFSTGFLWDTSLKPNWSAHWCTRCVHVKAVGLSQNELSAKQILQQESGSEEYCWVHIACRSCPNLIWTVGLFYSNKWTKTVFNETSASPVFSSWTCPCFEMWHWSASQRSPVWASASMRSSLSHSSPWPCVNLNRWVKQEAQMFRFTLHLLLWRFHMRFKSAPYPCRCCPWTPTFGSPTPTGKTTSRTSSRTSVCFYVLSWRSTGSSLRSGSTSEKP